jgi:ABC-type Fe3+/spermidine/putrescine transport system ATPase subunit
MLSVELSHRFGAFTLDVAFEAPGGVTVLFGKSGSGKTSVIKSVAGLLQPDRGVSPPGTPCFFDSGRRHFVPPHKRRMGYVFQEARLFPHLDVRRNLTLWATVRAAASGRGRGGGVRPDRRPAGPVPAARPASAGPFGRRDGSASPSAGRSCRGPALLLWPMSRWPPSMPIGRKKSCRISRGCGTILRCRSSM